MRKTIVSVVALAAVMVLAPAGAWALGVGAEVGRVQARSGPNGDNLGFFGRLGLIGPLELQLDLTRTGYEVERSDTRYGAGLRLEPFHLGKFLPALIAGVGIVDVESADWQGQLGFRELGLGLVYEFSTHLRAELNVRQGHQDVLVKHEDQDVSLLPGESSGDDSYTSGGLGLSLAF